jgi:prepilin-type N-terminal cleavage/methylation domain-containing protein
MKRNHDRTLPPSQRGHSGAGQGADNHRAPQTNPTRQRGPIISQRRQPPKTPPPTKARGFTLVELLVVIFIVLIISLVALPVIIPALSHRQVSEAARLLQSALAGAHDVALRNDAPAGIRLLPDPAFPLAYTRTGLDPAAPLVYNRLVPIEAAPEYTDGVVSITSPPTPWATTFASATGLVYPVLNPDGSSAFYPYPGIYDAGNVLMVEECVASTSGALVVPSVPTSWYWNIRLGDRIQINNAGPWYTIVGPMAITPATGNVEMFANVGLGGTTSPLVRTVGGSTVNPEFLFVVNGRDDNTNGWSDEGWDGLDNNGNKSTDELLEWEPETWLGAVSGGVTAAPYTIRRRPAPSANAREISLPTQVVIDATTWATSQERSRLPVSPLTGYVDILLAPNGSVVPSYVYSTPASFSMSSSFYHFWLAERSDVYPPAANEINASSPPYLPLPAGASLPAGYSTLFAGGGAINGEYRLVTLFTRTGQVTTNEEVRVDATANIAAGAFNTSVPFLQAQQGVRGGQ